MKIILFLLLLFFTSFNKPVVTSDQKKALDILKENSPESYHLIMQYLNTKDTYNIDGYEINFKSPVNLDSYIDYSNSLTIINSLPVAVHEVCHGYTNRNIYPYLQDHKIVFDPRERYDLLYLNSQKSVLIEKTNVFRTSQMHPLITDSLKSFRYQTYIFPASDIGAQLDGAYGLLDEWNAYYHDMRTTMDLYRVYQEIDIDEKYAVIEFLKVANSTHLAYVEFKYYILQYLIYASGAAPEVYFEIMANYGFRSAFTAINQQFSILNQEFFALKKKIIKNFTAKNIRAMENDQYFFLGGSGVGNFKQEYQRLEMELQQKQFQDLINTIIVN